MGIAAVRAWRRSCRSAPPTHLETSYRDSSRLGAAMRHAVCLAWSHRVGARDNQCWHMATHGPGATARTGRGGVPSIVDRQNGSYGSYTWLLCLSSSAKQDLDIVRPLFFSFLVLVLRFVCCGQKPPKAVSVRAGLALAVGGGVQGSGGRCGPPHHPPVLKRLGCSRYLVGGHDSRYLVGRLSGRSSSIPVVGRSRTPVVHIFVDSRLDICRYPLIYRYP